MSGTSLTQYIKALAGKPVEVITGRVESVHPIKIIGINDEQLKIPEAALVIPEHLRDRKVKINITMGKINFSTVTDLNTGLKTDDTVTMIPYDNWNRFLVIDREGEA